MHFTKEEANNLVNELFSAAEAFAREQYQTAYRQAYAAVVTIEETLPDSQLYSLREQMGEHRYSAGWQDGYEEGFRAGKEDRLIEEDASFVKEQSQHF